MTTVFLAIDLEFHHLIVDAGYGGFEELEAEGVATQLHHLPAYPFSPLSCGF
jgi:hypothetical protein